MLSDSSVIIDIILCLHDFSSVSYHDSAFGRADSAGRCSGIKLRACERWWGTLFPDEVFKGKNRSCHKHASLLVYTLCHLLGIRFIAILELHFCRALTR